MAAWGGSDGRDRRAAGRQQPGWPWTKPSRPWTKPSRRTLPTSSSRPTPAGAATGSCYGFQNLSDENLKTNLRPVRRPAHEGGVLARRFRLSLRAYVSKKEDDTELDFACEAVMNRASEHNVVALLDKWSTCWKHRGRTRAIGLHAYEKYSTLGFFGHGGVFGILRASQMKQACIAVNHFLRKRFPTQTWTSIAVLYNPSMPLHRRRRVWLEDENGQQRHCWKQKAVKNSCAERGLTCMTRPFRSSRKHHMLKKHRGNMWALAAYTPQAYKHAHESHVLNSATSLGSCVYRGVSRVVTAK